MVHVVSLTPPPEMLKEVVCRNCGATLQYMPNEVKSQYYRDYGGGGDTEYWIDCPPCGKKVTVKGPY